MQLEGSANELHQHFYGLPLQIIEQNRIGFEDFKHSDLKPQNLAQIALIQHLGTVGLVLEL